MTTPMNRKIFGTVVLAAALVVGACASVEEGAADVDSPTTTAEPSTTTSTTGQSSPAAPASASSEEPAMSETIEPAGTVTGGNVERTYVAEEYPPELSRIIGGMITDLSERLGVDATAIRVVAVEEVTWSDASLGCPQPGMSYAQVVTDGMRVILEAKAVFYDYRADGVQVPFLCERAAVSEKSSGPLLELTPEGVIRLDPPKEEAVPKEGLNPPDE